jgi:hypothetical protein
MTQTFYCLSQFCSKDPLFLKSVCISYNDELIIIRYYFRESNKDYIYNNSFPIDSQDYIIEKLIENTYEKFLEDVRKDETNG